MTVRHVTLPLQQLTELVRKFSRPATTDPYTMGGPLDDIALLESFYLSRQANGCTPATLAYYTENLRYLMTFTYAAGKQLGTLLRSDITHYIVESSQSGLSTASVNMRIRALRAFYNYLSDPEIHDGQPLIAVNPAAAIHEMKTDKRERPIPTRQQIAALLAGLPGRTFCTSRNRNIILVLYDTGIRSGELCGITTPDVDFRQGIIHIHHSKARRNRVVPVTDRTALSLHTYYNRYRKTLPGDWFFCMEDGRSMTVDRLHRILYDLTHARGFSASPKDWRHTFVTHYLENGGNPVVCQHITGHSDIRLIMTYEHTADDHAKVEHSKCAPTNGLKM